MVSIIRFAAVAAVFLLTTPFLSVAEQNPSQPQPSNPNIEQKALDILEMMGNYLADAKTLSFTASTMVETPVRGQILNFFARTKTLVKRPDRLAAITKSQNKPFEFYFDGKTMTSYSPKEKLYAVTSAPATLDELFPFAMEKAGIHTVFSDLMTSDPFAYLTDGLESGFWAGKALIGNIQTDHLAFKGKGIEWQIWIDSGEKPLPVMMTVTYTEIKDKPRYILQYSDWKINPPLKNSDFVFKKPAGAVKIPYQPITAEGGRTQ